MMEDEDQSDNQIQNNKNFEDVSELGGTADLQDIRMHVPQHYMVDDTTQRYGSLNDMQQQIQMQKYLRKIKFLWITLIITAVLLVVFVIALIAVSASKHKDSGPHLMNYNTNYTYEEQFKYFQAEYGKKYGTDKLKEFRFELFTSNLLYFDALKTMYDTEFGEGFSKFYDYSYDEFLFLLGSIPEYQKNKEVIMNGTNLPERVDWRNESFITQPIDLGSSCAAAHIFQSVGAIEAAYSIYKNQSVILSIQQPLDCINTTRMQGGCLGGIVSEVFNFTVNFGLQDGINNTYQFTQRACNYTKTGNYKIQGWAQVPKNNMTALKAAVAQQPVVALIDGGNLQAYKYGVLEWNWCPVDVRVSPNLAILIVGYEYDYFIARNSFGTEWGEDGYFRIRMSDGIGVCGVNMDAKYPIV